MAISFYPGLGCNGQNGGVVGSLLNPSRIALNEIDGCVLGFPQVPQEALRICERGRFNVRTAEHGKAIRRADGTLEKNLEFENHVALLSGWSGFQLAKGFFFGAQRITVALPP
ncbi:hypothetical protein [Burkholderia vietnamiensis]|uniref:hypothetical protein n=1 Tax=Burkholderia vietnamiensis TaxID=60552 RepID=UPI0015935C62|nr:hypothetical protein [Burkholderia vietnamiensis]MCA8270378.1 hypothetical protein [Burkholderia vietnamiensis]